MSFLSPRFSMTRATTSMRPAWDAAPGSARGEDAKATGATKKDIFGLGTAYGDAIATGGGSEYGAMRTPRVSRDVFAAFSFRYAAIEALHIAKTTPKAWLDRE